MRDIINITMGELTTAVDNEVVKAVQKVGMDVDKEELLKALELYRSLVRCRECKYYNNDYTGEWCGRFRDPHPCRADGFCSYGKRSEKPNNSKDDLHDVGRQIQSAYDKGTASDTSAIQALYTAVKPCKGEPQIFTWGKEVHEFCKMKCNKSKARSFDGDRFIVCGQSNDAICINLPACPLGKWIAGKGYHILPMDESQTERSK